MNQWWKNIRYVNRYLVKCLYENDDCGIDLFVDACSEKDAEAIVRKKFPTYRITSIKNYWP